MVLGKVIRTTMFLVAVAVFSCEEPLIINCEDCLYEEPVEALLEIKVTSGRQSSRVLINIYEGDLEENILFHSFELLGGEASYHVPLNKQYTLTATYSGQSAIYTTVDSVIPRVKFDDQQCDNTCFYIYDNKVNLELKSSL